MSRRTDVPKNTPESWTTTGVTSSHGTGRFAEGWDGSWPFLTLEADSKKSAARLRRATVC